MTQPRYPIYIPSKGRAGKRCLTARYLRQDGVPFWLVVEPQEADAYRAEFGSDVVLVLPWRDAGTVTPARNWIKAHATASGAVRHWQLDDNMYGTYRFHRGQRLRCPAGPAFAAVEDFTDRYDNIAIAGMNYDMFAVGKMPPFHLNVHVYSCCLVLNALPYLWRPRYNEDTDYCLQALSDGWCTVLINAFLVKKVQTMILRGGNTTELYQGDGRLRMARSLARDWPHVVSVQRRFKRPQHVVKDSWKRFDTPLIRRQDLDFSLLPQVDEYGLALVQKDTCETRQRS